jgi:SAM-dependent methyltransferase
MFSFSAAKKILKLPNLNSILDIGSGNGDHALFFAKNNKKVFCVDIHDSKSSAYEHPNIFFVCADFMGYDLFEKVDCVWASHLLEHQLNVNLFLKKCISMLHPGGYIAITVPPAKHQIVGGHVTIWNAGLIMYNLILAGTSCKNAMIKQYGYNTSVIVQYEAIKLPPLNYDNGDIEKLSPYFPEPHNYHGFNGQIYGHNW